MKKIVILTGSETRHLFFRKYIALCKDIQVINTYCEGAEKSLSSLFEQNEIANSLRLKHLEARARSEEDFFGTFIEKIPDHSNPIPLPKGEINAAKHANAIIHSRPDLLVAYGCSIIRDPLLSAFHGRFLNVHLGLSPYYRGSGTNYWPLVNGEPEFVGATFMHIDAGVDTGEIIHQIRAKYSWADTPSQIGNRLIVEMARVYQTIIVNFERLAKVPPIEQSPNSRIYRNKDFTEHSVTTLYKNFENGLIQKYLSEETARCAKVPIRTNPALEICA